MPRWQPMRNKEQGWTTYLLVRWAQFRLALRTDDILRTKVFVDQSIVFEWPVTTLQAT